MCYPAGEFRTGGSDVLLDELHIEGFPEPVPVWMSAAQFGYWRHTHLTIDVVPGRGSGFTLEAPEGVLPDPVAATHRAGAAVFRPLRTVHPMTGSRVSRAMARGC